MIYIQSAIGLTQVSPSLTKEKIIAALGYTPADQNTFYEDESGALVIADEKGYVIARIDQGGLTTTKVSAGAIQLDGEDLAAKLQELENKVPDIDLSGYATQKYVDDKVTNIEIPEVDLSALDSHLDDADVHVTPEDKESWDAKSDFSGAYKDLEGAPHIVNDNEDEVVICDSQGNVILRATAEGLNVAAVYVNGVRVDEPIWKFTVNDREYSVTPSTQKWSDWLAANSDKNFQAVAHNIVYDMISSQYLHDVTINDFIIPGYKYTYTPDGK